MSFFISLPLSVIRPSVPISFDVTSYIPLYFSVKWSNSANGTQTIKVERNKPTTFSFNSTTSTETH